ncbi:MAG TPA: phosphatidate cytidylyltransferase [Phycisphaerae bacterium]|nr:phosphatidate cytidylyltransferase [Phycisphaerae bacterium]
MLWQRILFGSVMIAALVGLLLLDAWLAAGLPNQSGPAHEFRSHPPTRLWGLPTVSVTAVLAFFAALEFGLMLKSAGYAPARFWAAIISVGLVVLPWVEQMTATTAARSAAGSALGPTATPVWLMGGLVGTCLLILARRRTQGAIAAIATTFLIISYVGLLGSFLIRIRCLAPGPAGAILILYAVLCIKSCDIGAYLLGRIFGRTPLAPWLSPKKTVEGFVAGLIMSCLMATGGMAAWGAWGSATLGQSPLGLLQALVFGIVMAVMGHLGDLTESAFKRDVGVKDSGAVVASFGGFLDILDSPWFAAPAAWWLLTFLGAMR